MLAVWWNASSPREESYGHEANAILRRTIARRLPNVRAASLPNAAERGWQPKSALFLGRQKEISQQQLEHTVQVHQLYYFRERLSPWYDADYVFYMCLFVFLCGCVCSLEWVPRV